MEGRTPSNGKSECDYKGNINTIGNQGQWKELEITVDSGAYNNVCGKELMPEIGMKETKASRRGEYFFTASKEKVHNLGEKTIKGYNDEGVPAGIVFQVVEKVKDNLASVRKICSAGNRVIFDDDDPEGSYILNKISGRRTPIQLKNGNYVFKMWVPFQGQA